MINIDEIGALDKRVEILTDGEYEDEIGLTHIGMTPVFPHRIWARIEPTRGRAYFEQYKDKTEDFLKITIRALRYAVMRCLLADIPSPLFHRS